MIELNQKQKGLLMLLGVVTILLVLILAFAIPGRDSGQKNEEEGGTFVQTIPDGVSTEVSDSRSEAFRRASNTEAMWNSLDEAQKHKDGVADDGARPEVPSVEQIFGPEKTPPEPEKKPAVKTSGGRAAASAKRSSKKKNKQKPDAAGQMPAPPQTKVKRSDAISSLDEDVVETLGHGFSTLDGGDRYIQKDEGHPYRCMFTRSEKVKSGQRISVRLLEDLMISGEMIPQNTHLSAVCSISDRMNITITSIELRGRILSFKLEAYDTDGGKGIYCTDIGQGRKTATDQGIATVTSSLSSSLGRVANDAIGVGASIIRSKTGEVTVEIPAGYVFYVIESKER